MFEFLRYILLGRYQFSKKSLYYLKLFNNQKIKKITVARYPLPDALRIIASHLSHNQVYEKLYHVYLIVQFEEYGQLVVEKTEIVSISNTINYFRDAEYHNIPNSEIPEGLTFGEFISEGQKYMTPQRFFQYSVSTANCQDFAVSLLEANNIKSGATGFILQPVSSIFANHRRCREIIDEIIHTRAMLDVGYDTINELNPMRFRRQ
jgi:hypothetical protein